MTDETTQQPAFQAFAVREAGEKSYYTKIGVAFTHAKGGGLTIELSALPTNAQILLFPPRDEEHPQNPEL